MAVLIHEHSECPELRFVTYCPICYDRNEFYVDKKLYYEWKRSKLGISYTFKDISGEQAELMMTGTCRKCWDKQRLRRIRQTGWKKIPMKNKTTFKQFIINQAVKAFTAFLKVGFCMFLIFGLFTIACFGYAGFVFILPFIPAIVCGWLTFLFAIYLASKINWARLLPANYFDIQIGRNMEDKVG